MTNNNKTVYQSLKLWEAYDIASLSMEEKLKAFPLVILKGSLDMRKELVAKIGTGVEQAYEV